MIELLILTVCATSIWYLGSAAVITELPRLWIAVRWPSVSHWLACPACSGLWYGAGLAGLAAWIRRPILDLDLPAAIVVSGVVCLTCVPLLGRLLLDSLIHVGRILSPSDESSDGDGVKE